MAMEELRKNEAVLRKLSEFVQFPSVSAFATHVAALRTCAAWLASHLRTIGLDHADVLPTGGHPVVFADWHHAPGRLTLLIYGHYDVQPAEPLEAWQSPPFVPTVRED
jgi:acetylornithine deacetylase/succinyl-diaminopimelate desuccinylase-like protein